MDARRCDRVPCPSAGPRELAMACSREYGQQGYESTRAWAFSGPGPPTRLHDYDDVARTVLCMRHSTTESGKA